MGSAALRDAIQGIIDWGETVGGVNGGLPKATEAFGSLTFNDEAQKARLPKTAYAALRQTIVHGQPLEPEVADLVAGRTRVHRERVERVHQRRDLLAETHVESRGPRKRHVGEDQQESESPGAQSRRPGRSRERARIH